MNLLCKINDINCKRIAIKKLYCTVIIITRLLRNCFYFCFKYFRSIITSAVFINYSSYDEIKSHLFMKMCFYELNSYIHNVCQNNIY